MAKGSVPRGGPSRIRFIMVEADLHEGDLEQVTQVLQNAFRTTQVIPTRPQISRPALKNVAAAAEDDEVENRDAEQDDMFVDDSPPAKARPPRKPRPAKVPTVLNDIDVKSEPSLKDFVSQYDLKTGFEKYLIIALWFRDARSINSVTVDHIYTCFKLLGWPTSSTDFSKPLKNLRDNQDMTGDTKGYSLSLTGAGKVEAKKRPIS